jgi:hypothetical protein
MTPKIALKILAARDALLADDKEEAYHQLYAIADESFTSPTPWWDLEQLALSEPTPESSANSSSLARRKPN